MTIEELIKKLEKYKKRYGKNTKIYISTNSFFDFYFGPLQKFPECNSIVCSTQTFIDDKSYLHKEERIIILKED